jgi:hypothetical protein
MKQVFVFGSNLAGRHGRGSAYAAKVKWGARNGVGVGRAGDSYAIPTKDSNLKVLPLSSIRRYVETFKQYARENAEIEFLVVKIGCGLAGYREEDIKPLFQDAPINCKLPRGWR